ncbi:MAG: hypothetical protein ABL863_02040 [Nitrosomonas sp.]
MHAVDTDIAWNTIRLRGAAFADGNPSWVCLGPMPSFVLVLLVPTQVVQVRNRYVGQTLKVHITKYLKRTLHELLGGRPGRCVMQHIHLGQKGYVRHCVTASEAVFWGNTLRTDLADISAQMKTQSAATVAGMIPYFSSNEALRIAQSIFAVMSSEFGNLIGSRVDSLMIQLYGYGDFKNDSGPIVRSQMHLHKYLSDSSVTKAPKLYDWYDAKAPFIIEEWKYLIPGFNANMDERIKIYETIFNDVYWSNVNTVYASGIGKVNMALIRDEIGNWNLKNFDNDPTELLSAYKDLTLQSIKTTIDLAKKVSSGGSALAADAVVVNITNKIVSRLNDTDPPTVPIAKLNQRVSTQLKSLQLNTQTEWDAINCKSAAAQDQMSSCKEILQNMSKKIKEFLHDYSIVLNTMQEMSLPVSPIKTIETKQVTEK